MWRISLPMQSNQDTTRVYAATAPLEEASVTSRSVRHLTPFGPLTIAMDTRRFEQTTMLQYLQAAKFALAHTGTLSQRLCLSGSEWWNIPMVIPVTRTSGEESKLPEGLSKFVWRLQTTLSPLRTPSHLAFEPSEWQVREAQSAGTADFHARLCAPQVTKLGSCLHVLSVSRVVEPNAPKNLLLSSVYMALLLADAYILSYVEAVWDEGSIEAYRAERRNEYGL